MIDIIIEYLEFNRKKNSENFTAKDFLYVFQNIDEISNISETKKFVDYCFKNIKNFTKGKKEIATFIINYYVLSYNAAILENEKNGYGEKIDKFLSQAQTIRIVDNNYLIFLFRKFQLKDQVLKVLEIMGRKLDLIEICFQEQKYEACFDYCIKYRGDADLPIIFLRMICEKSTTTIEEERQKKDLNIFVPKILELIRKQDTYSHHFIIKLLKKNKFLILKDIKKYFFEFISEKIKDIDEEEKECSTLVMEIEEKKDKLYNFKTKPVLFQPTICFTCKTKINNPAVYFLCRHYFHYRCLATLTCSECNVELEEALENRELFEKEEVKENDIPIVNYSNCIEYLGKSKF